MLNESSLLSSPRAPANELSAVGGGGSPSSTGRDEKHQMARELLDPHKASSLLGEDEVEHESGVKAAKEELASS